MKTKKKKGTQNLSGVFYETSKYSIFTKVANMDGSSNIESDMDLDNYDMDLEMDNAMDICSEIGESERISKVPKSEKKRGAS